jgi:hypothetical protein
MSSSEDAHIFLANPMEMGAFHGRWEAYGSQPCQALLSTR